MKKRLLVAISLSQELLQELEAVQNRLKPFASEAKWVKLSGAHLTLKFLGYTDPQKVPSIVQSLNSVSTGHPAMKIEMRGCGFFPNSRRPNVLWVGVVSEKLLPFQAAVEEAMAALGFEKEKRAFSPHLTLARFKDSHGLLPLTQEAQTLSDSHFGDMAVNRFSLFESILRPQGAEYYTVESFHLVE